MKRIISLVLVMCMLLSATFVAFADNELETPDDELETAAYIAPPSDFHYVYQYSGNTSVDAVLYSTTVGLVMLTIPLPSYVSFFVEVAMNLQELYSSSQTLQGDYTKYVYRPDNPADYPAVDSWVYVVYYADVDQNGVKERIGENSYYETIVLPAPGV